MTLYRAEAFEPLTDTAWSEARARDGIRDIVADTDAAWRGPKLFWRAHEWDRWNSTSPQKNLYVGTTGVLWALDQLRRRGYVETKTMPLGNVTGMTQAERHLLGRWIAQGAKIP